MTQMTFAEHVEAVTKRVQQEGLPLFEAVEAEMENLDEVSRSYAVAYWTGELTCAATLEGDTP